MNIICERVPRLSGAWTEAAQYLIEIYDAEYKGDVSTTQLVAPVQQVLLCQRHDPEITEDVQDHASLIGGSGTHEILKMAAEHYGHKLCEQRFTIPFMGKEIGVKADRVDVIPYTDPIEYRLIEFKECKTYAVIKDEKEDWIWQCRIQAYALQKIGINVTEAQVEALLKNWSISDLEKAKRERRDYPEHQITFVPVDLVEDERVEAYMEERLSNLIDANELEDYDLPECTSKERWMRDECFKVWKIGKTDRASIGTMKDETGRRVAMTTREMAETAMQEKGYSTSEYEVRYHPGKAVRCEHYCSAKEFCHQYQQYKEGEF